MKFTSKRHSSPVAILTLAVLLGLTSAAAAEPPHFGGGFGGDLFRMERLARKLDLSAEQQSEFERIMEQGREQARPYVKQMVASHAAMDALMDADTFDEAAVRAQIEASHEVMTDLALIHARSRHQIRQLLTPEQREKMDAQREMMNERRKRRMPSE